MYVSKRVRKDGSVFFSFTFFNQEGKRVRLKKSEHPHFNTYEEAEVWANSQLAFRSAQKAALEQKLAWKTKYYDFAELLKRYEEWQKEKAPNSWRMNVQYIEAYVFDFYLNQKHASNVNHWHQLHQEFLDWIKNKAVAAKGGKQLAKNTAKNIIQSLNTFLECLATYHLIDPQFNIKCKSIPEHLTNKRSHKDLIPREEMLTVYQVMKSINEAAAEFFYVLWHTGMRFSELFGLPITSLHNGAIPNKALQEELEEKKIKCIGFIYLDSQPFSDDRKREPDGSLKRKPLKSMREISAKHARSIPIEDKECWNILARRHKIGKENLLKRVFTSELNDYCLFDGLEWNRANLALQKAYKHLGWVPKQYHCCRHSFTTYLVGRTRSFFLVRAITGHKSDSSFERYLHIFEQMAIENSAKIQDIEEIS